jgi:hypothetical protein
MARLAIDGSDALQGNELLGEVYGAAERVDPKPKSTWLLLFSCLACGFIAFSNIWSWKVSNQPCQSINLAGLKRVGSLIPQSVGPDLCLSRQ